MLRLQQPLPDDHTLATPAQLEARIAAAEVEECWDALAGVIDVERVVPITYVNSSAAVKAFVGRHGGACCTSSNARGVLTWALERGDRVLFVPDQHLGRNTALAMGYPP